MHIQAYAYMQACKAGSFMKIYIHAYLDIYATYACSYIHIN